MKSSSYFKERLTVFSASDKIHAFKRPLKFWKTCLLHYELDRFPIPYLKTFSDNILADINNFYTYNKTYQNFIDLDNAGSRYFPNVQYWHYVHDDSVKTQDSSVDLNVVDTKSSLQCLDSTRQIAFKISVWFKEHPQLPAQVTRHLCDSWLPSPTGVTD